MITQHESKESILIKKKEAELREAKRKENERKRKFETQMKCVIGGTFHKYFKEAYLFDQSEWDKIIRALVATDTFREVVTAIYDECTGNGIDNNTNPKGHQATIKTAKKSIHEAVTAADNATYSIAPDYYVKSDTNEAEAGEPIYSTYKV